MDRHYSLVLIHVDKKLPDSHTMFTTLDHAWVLAVQGDRGALSKRQVYATDEELTPNEALGRLLDGGA